MGLWKSWKTKKQRQVELLALRESLTIFYLVSSMGDIKGPYTRCTGWPVYAGYHLVGFKPDLMRPIESPLS